jgi:putative membrane protein
MLYPGTDGFLGTRGSLTLDLVVLIMAAFLPLLGLSVYLVRYRKKYALHKRLQIALSLGLVVTVVAFEVDMRTNGWEDRATSSPYYAGGSYSPVKVSLGVHLFFAVTTALLWALVVVRAMSRFPVPPAPNEHSRWHRFWGRLAAIDMCCTAVTGWIFYWLAFVAT